MPEVRVLGGLRHKVGAQTLDVPADRVGELLEALVERSGEELRALFYEDPQATPQLPHRDLRVLVNGRSMAFLAGLDTALGDGDTVTVHLSGARGYPGG